MTVVKVGKVEDVPPGTGKVVEAGGLVLAVFNLGGTWYALNNTCTHAGGPLGEGKVDGNVVTCPWHGSRFDIRSGQVLQPPARRPVATYPIKVQGGEMFVELP
jgi:nitrite reductase/ring-hydroxylating ferredoxin subunit